MLNNLIRLSPKASTDFTLKLILAIAFICFLGPEVIQVQKELPITLQTLMILIFAIAFGWKIGFFSTLSYVALGLAGVPVFAGHVGGLSHMNGVFGGFFFGFIVAALICGYLAELPMMSKSIPHLLLWFLGHIIILGLGAIWMMRFDPTGWKTKITMALPAAAAKSAVGFFVLSTVRRLLMRKVEKKMRDA